VKAKNVQMRIKAAGDDGSFVATFATLNVIDKDRDVTLPGAFEDGAPVRISAWGHNWGALPVGKGVIHADDERAWVEGQFFLDTAHGKDTYLTVKALGDLQEWSYGYDILDAAPGQVEGQDVQLLRGLKVHEVSPVLIGAGVDTRTDQIKSAKTGRRNSAADTEAMRQALEALDAAKTTIEALLGDDEPKAASGGGTKAAAGRKQAVAGSYEAQTELLSRALAQRFGGANRWVYPVATFDDRVVASIMDDQDGSREYREVEYTMLDGKVSLGADRAVELQASVVPKGQDGGVGKAEDRASGKAEDPRPGFFAAKVALQLLEMGVS
jgi:HK97 family phage prohead protease